MSESRVCQKLVSLDVFTVTLCILRNSVGNVSEVQAQVKEVRPPTKESNRYAKETVERLRRICDEGGKNARQYQQEPLSLRRESARI